MLTGIVVSAAYTFDLAANGVVLVVFKIFDWVLVERMGVTAVS